jgi:CBS domain-containing protein|tara:strand:+ start:181 stop:666 length:486 start_codon:yes stop_codon:yes gene_type:complete
MVTVRNIMSENVITVHENSTISEASKLMVNKNISCLLVVKEKKPIAIITENDVIKKAILKGKNSDKTKVKEIMNKDYHMILPHTKYTDILKDFREKDIRRFPVVDDGNILIGLVTESDIVQATRDFTRMHHIMQEVILAVFGVVTAFFLFFFSPLGSSIFR